MSNFKKELEGHTVECRSSGTGSIDPWTRDFAREINCPLIGTTDMAQFILIDGDAIYKIEFRDALELYELWDAIESWDIFLNEWWKPKIEKCYVVDFGSLKESIENIKDLKKKNDVWATIPEKEKRKVYEYLKTLSKEEVDKWYEEKMKELGL